MSYSTLTKETIPSYVLKTHALRELLGEGTLDIQEVGDGNLNFVFIVRGPNQAIVVKQAVPYLRCVGESWPLSLDRMDFETKALLAFYQLIPNHVPKVYHQDSEMRLVAMQYLGNHLILRKGMIGSTIYPHVAKHIAAFLAETLFKTSSFYLSSREKRELEQKFNANHDLCKLTEDLIFTFPYFEQESNHHFQKMEEVAKKVREDRVFKEKVLDLKYRFMNQKDALVHGDLHTGSIMVNTDETFVIDPEFAFFGPFGFDIGAFMGNLLLSFISHQVLDQQKEYSEWILKAFQEFWVTFETLFLENLSSQKESALITSAFFDAESLQSYFRSILRKILQQSIGFAGCKMARRILGLAGVADIRGIADENLRFLAEEKSLLLAVQLIKHHDEISSLNDVLEIVRDRI